MENEIKFFEKLPKEYFAQLWEILETNMKVLAGQDWDEKEKKSELLADWMRFYIVFEKSMIVGFSAFRFDEDDDRNVIYIYEIQLSVFGKGLGSRLIQLISDLAQKDMRECLVLTTLKSNPKAKKFYLKNGFKKDRTDPSLFGYKENYEILSKYF